jgi:hypothetical protein
MAAVGFSETSETEYQTAGEDNNVHGLRSVNLRSHLSVYSP